MPNPLPDPLAGYRDKITVTFERRPDGGLRIYSNELPGLALSHADHAAVLADLRPAIEGLVFDKLAAAETERDALRARAERAEKALDGIETTEQDLRWFSQNVPPGMPAERAAINRLVRDHKRLCAALAQHDPSEES